MYSRCRLHFLCQTFYRRKIARQKISPKCFLYFNDLIRISRTAAAAAAAVVVAGAAAMKQKIIYTFIVCGKEWIDGPLPLLFLERLFYFILFF